MAKKVFAFVELQDAAPRKISLQALGEARRIADTWNSEVHAIVVGKGAAETAPKLISQGADKVLLGEDAAFDTYQVEAFTNALSSLLSDQGDFILVFSNTALARDLGPRLAQRLGTAYLNDITETHVSEDSSIEFTRPIYAGKASERLAVRSASVIATLRGNSFAASEADGSRTGETVPLAVGDGPESKAKLRSIELREGDEVDLTEADIIVSGGYGLGGPEGFEFLKPIRELLGAAQGASRAAVNAGWIDQQHQVGQTGKTVSPSLYLACGISGQIQHLAGMSSAKCIVAIDTDPDAPIFKLAHYGIVGDLFKVIPALKDEIEKLQSSG